ncbi:replication protein P [Thioalbus denitrificans]|nr:replication protein P [Thioalbus denitrificans]
MSEFYGHRWESQYGQPGGRAYQTWRRGLRGITPKQLAFGLSRCADRGDDWPPPLPTFRRWCQPTPEDLGLPGLEQAYREAVRMAGQHESIRGDWSHPAIYHAATQCGLFELATLTEAKARPLFERAYQIVCRRTLAGEEFAAPIPRALPTRATVVDRTAAKAAVGRLKEILGR